LKIQNADKPSENIEQSFTFMLHNTYQHISALGLLHNAGAICRPCTSI